MRQSPKQLAHQLAQKAAPVAPNPKGERNWRKARHLPLLLAQQMAQASSFPLSGRMFARFKLYNLREGKNGHA